MCMDSRADTKTDRNRQKKSCMQETKNLLTDMDSSTDTKKNPAQ